MLHKKRASVFQQGRELFRPCIFSIIQHYWDRIAGPLDAHLTACPLYYAGDVVSPRQIITWPSWSLQPSCIQWCAPWSKPVPHNCVLFPVTSPEGVRGGKKIKLLVFLASPPQQSNREATGRPGEEAAATGFCASTEHRLAAEPGPEIRSEPARLQGKGRGGAKAALSQSRKKGRPWAFPVVQLKQAKTSLHLHSLRVSADWGPKFSHFQCTARREVLEEKPAAALLLTALSALA